MKRKCSKCKRTFECKSSDITSCWCNNIKISKIRRSYIKKQYNNCLCPKCLENSAFAEKKVEFIL